MVSRMPLKHKIGQMVQITITQILEDKVTRNPEKTLARIRTPTRTRS
jgi:hypothetical protein